MEERKMQQALGLVPPGESALPEGTGFLANQLDDPTECQYFIERFIRLSLHSRSGASAWLSEARRKPHFTRLILIKDPILVGELVIWMERRVGTIAHVFTLPAWRRKGVASHLMRCALQMFYEWGAHSASLDVRAQLEGAVSLAAKSGFRQSEIVSRYWGLQLND